MTKIWIVGCILCTLLLLPVAVAADGNISISSDPIGATIYLDNISQSVITPTTLYNVTTGPHLVLLQRTGYQNWSLIVTVNGNQTVTAPLSPEVTTTTTTATPTANVTTTTTTVAPVVNGSIAFTSSPTNANVYINTVLKGYTPITIYNLTPDSYAVTVQKSGYLIYAQRVNVTSGNTTTVSTILTVEPTDTPTLSATVPITTATTATPTIKSTAKVFTPWPTNTPTTQSPVPIEICIGAIGAGLVLLKRWG
ncbi:MAG: PEGA domain-containing protein [Methanoregula sp.]|nr:PEGA domain-containing protein [Methanoregula sp.]